jgi:hypothetical protein
MPTVGGHRFLRPPTERAITEPSIERHSPNATTLACREITIDGTFFHRFECGLVPPDHHLAISAAEIARVMDKRCPVTGNHIAGTKVDKG